MRSLREAICGRMLLQFFAAKERCRTRRVSFVSDFLLWSLALRNVYKVFNTLIEINMLTSITVITRRDCASLEQYLIV